MLENLMTASNAFADTRAIHEAEIGSQINRLAAVSPSLDSLPSLTKEQCAQRKATWKSSLELYRSTSQLSQKFLDSHTHVKAAAHQVDDLPELSALPSPRREVEKPFSLERSKRTLVSYEFILDERKRLAAALIENLECDDDLRMLAEEKDGLFAGVTSQLEESKQLIDFLQETCRRHREAEARLEEALIHSDDEIKSLLQRVNDMKMARFHFKQSRFHCSFLHFVAALECC